MVSWLKPAYMLFGQPRDLDITVLSVAGPHEYRLIWAHAMTFAQRGRSSDATILMFATQISTTRPNSGGQTQFRVLAPNY